MIAGAAFSSPVAYSESADPKEKPAYSPSLVITNDTIADVQGGAKRGTVNQTNIDATVSVDTEQAGLWSGGTFFVYAMADFGGSAAGMIGDAQGSSNIDSVDAVRLYEAWYQHDFMDGKVSVLAGLRDYNKEFYFSEYAGVFRNSSFGIGPDMAQLPAPIFPETALAARIKVHPTDNSYFQAAIFDGNPGNPSLPVRDSHIHLKGSDGLLAAVEVGLHSTDEEADSNLYKVALGLWERTTNFTDYQNIERDSAHGGYVTIDKSLYHDCEDGSLGAFFQAGFTPGDREQHSRYLGAGLNYTGLISGRPKDITGLSWARVKNSGQYLQSTPDMDQFETVLEATYRAQVNDWLAIQPDFQRIINPGTNKSLKDASVVTLRMQAAF